MDCRPSLTHKHTPHRTGEPSPAKPGAMSMAGTPPARKAGPATTPRQGDISRPASPPNVVLLCAHVLSLVSCFELAPPRPHRASVLVVGAPGTPQDDQDRVGAHFKKRFKHVFCKLYAKNGFKKVTYTHTVGADGKDTIRCGACGSSITAAATVLAHSFLKHIGAKKCGHNKLCLPVKDGTRILDATAVPAADAVQNVRAYRYDGHEGKKPTFHGEIPDGEERPQWLEEELRTLPETTSARWLQRNALPDDDQTYTEFHGLSQVWSEWPNLNDLVSENCSDGAKVEGYSDDVKSEDQLVLLTAVQAGTFLAYSCNSDINGPGDRKEHDVSAVSAALTSVCEGLALNVEALWNLLAQTPVTLTPPAEEWRWIPERDKAFLMTRVDGHHTELHTRFAAAWSELVEKKQGICSVDEGERSSLSDASEDRSQMAVDEDEVKSMYDDLEPGDPNEYMKQVHEDYMKGFVHKDKWRRLREDTVQRGADQRMAPVMSGPETRSTERTQILIGTSQCAAQWNGKARAACIPISATVCHYYLKRSSLVEGEDPNAIHCVLAAALWASIEDATERKDRLDMVKTLGVESEEPQDWHEEDAWMKRAGTFVDLEWMSSQGCQKALGCGFKIGLRLPLGKDVDEMITRLAHHLGPHLPQGRPEKQAWVLVCSAYSMSVIRHGTRYFLADSHGKHYKDMQNERIRVTEDGEQETWWQGGASAALRSACVMQLGWEKLLDMIDQMFVGYQRGGYFHEMLLDQDDVGRGSLNEEQILRFQHLLSRKPAPRWRKTAAKKKRVSAQPTSHWTRSRPPSKKSKHGPRSAAQVVPNDSQAAAAAADSATPHTQPTQTSQT